MIDVYGCAENEGLEEEICPNVSYADGDFCPEHGGVTEEQRRREVAESLAGYEAKKEVL